MREKEAIREASSWKNSRWLEEFASRSCHLQHRAGRVGLRGGLDQGMRARVASFVGDSFGRFAAVAGFCQAKALSGEVQMADVCEEERTDGIGEFKGLVEALGWGLAAQSFPIESLEGFAGVAEHSFSFADMRTVGLK